MTAFYTNTVINREPIIHVPVLRYTIQSQEQQVEVGMVTVINSSTVTVMSQLHQQQ